MNTGDACGLFVLVMVLVNSFVKVWSVQGGVSYVKHDILSEAKKDQLQE